MRFKFLWVLAIAFTFLGFRAMADNIASSELWNPSSGDTISASSYQGDIDVIVNTINGDIDSENIEDNTVASADIAAGTIVNSDVNASADITPGKINSGDTDATLAALLRNHISGCYMKANHTGSNAQVTVREGSVTINDRWFENTSDTTATCAGSDGTWYYVWVTGDGGGTTFGVTLTDSNTTAGATNERMIASAYWEGDGTTTTLTTTREFRDGFITGWDYMAGDNTRTIEEAIYYGGADGAVTFNDVDTVMIQHCPLGSETDAFPAGPSEFADQSNATLHTLSDTTTSGGLTMIITHTDSGQTLGSTAAWGYSFRAEGCHSAMPTE